MSRIKELISRIKFRVKIKLVRRHDKLSEQSCTTTMKYLIKEYNEKLRKVRIKAEVFKGVTNIKHYGNCLLMREEIVASRSAQEVLRMNDSKEAEKQHAKKKLGYDHKLIDIEVRNAFKANKVTLSIIKCACRQNHYRVRESMFNNDMVKECCLQYEAAETRDHVIKCNKMIDIRKKFMKKLLIELLKNRDKVEANEIIAFCEDILRHLENETDKECETNEYYVGMTELLRGHVAVEWKEANFEHKKHGKLNKILA